MKQASTSSQNKLLLVFLKAEAMTYKTGYSLNPDGTVDIIRMGNGTRQRMNRKSCQETIETVTKNKEWYGTEEAYNEALDVFKGAMTCFPKEGESNEQRSS